MGAVAALFHTDHVFWPAEADADAKMRGIHRPHLNGNDQWVDADSANRSVVEYFMANVIIGEGGSGEAEARWEERKADALRMIDNLPKRVKNAQIVAWNAWLDAFNVSARAEFGDDAPQFSHIDEDSGNGENPAARAQYDMLTGDSGFGPLREETTEVLENYLEDKFHEGQARVILQVVYAGFSPADGLPDDALDRAVAAAVLYGVSIVEELEELEGELAAAGEPTAKAVIRTLAGKWRVLFTR